MFLGLEDRIAVRDVGAWAWRLGLGVEVLGVYVG